ncbi:MAG: hypothetical protein ACOYZ7_16165 [Chloroflexota bacterium]
MSARQKSSPAVEPEPVAEAVETAAQETPVRVEAAAAPAAVDVSPAVETPTPAARPELGERLQVQREMMAQWLAFGIVIVFGLITLCLVVCGLGASLIGFLAAAAAGGEVVWPVFDALEAAKVVLPYLATPLGVALGYYFTRRAAEQK